MTDHEKSIKIINELNLTLVEVGKIIGCTWKAVQNKKSGINYNKFTPDNLEKLQDFKNNKIKTLNNI